MGFGLQFQKSLEKGIPQGLQAFLSNRKLEASAQREQDKKKQKMIEKDKQVTAQANILGVDPVRDPETQELGYTIPEDIDLTGISDVDRLKFLPDVGAEFRGIFKELDQPKDFYVNKKVKMNAQGEGAVFAIDNDPSSETYGSEIEIGKAPDYQFKISDETMFDGEIDFEGQKIGIKGKRSKLIQYENGTFDIIQGVSDIKDSKTLEKEEFESKMARIMQDRTKALERYETALGSGADIRILETKRERVNSDLNRIAWDSYKLGSDEAKVYMEELYEEGRNTINKGFVGMPNTRLDYYERKKAEIYAQVERGEWSFEDETAIYQFLQAKYEKYVVSVDPIKDKDEFIFDIPEFDKDK